MFKKLITNNIIVKALHEVQTGEYNPKEVIKQLSNMDKFITETILTSEIDNCKKKMLLCGLQSCISPA
jgi:hypothetical protein